jgi:hypothetical protein
MRRRPVLAPLSLVLALTGCARRGDADDPAQALAVTEEAPAAWSQTPALAPLPQHEGPVRMQHMNMEIEVADPTKTLAAARTLVLSLGGEITNANASAGAAASLNATFAPQALERVRHGLGQLPGTIRSENSSVSDMTQHCDMLRDRLQQLGVAEVELERIMRTTRDPTVFEAMLVQRELGTRERESLRQQLAQQFQQAERAQLYLTIHPMAAPANVHVIRDPIRALDH